MGKGWIAKVIRETELVIPDGARSSALPWKLTRAAGSAAESIDWRKPCLQNLLRPNQPWRHVLLAECPEFGSSRFLRCVANASPGPPEANAETSTDSHTLEEEADKPLKESSARLFMGLVFP